MIMEQSLSGICQGYHTIRGYGAKLSGICQGYHMKIRDYGAKFVRNISGLPYDDK
jgi:hypothetical protein